MSKAKRNGGYVLVDFSGVNMYDENPQVIPGIFTAVDAALKTNKPIIAINVVMAEEEFDTLHVSPIPMYGTHEAKETGEIDPDKIRLIAAYMQAIIMRDGDTEAIVLAFGA